MSNPVTESPVQGDQGTRAPAGIVAGMSFADYRANPAANIHALMDFAKSPAYYRWRRDNPRQLTTESKKAFDLGRAIHAMVLEGDEAFESQFAVMPPNCQRNSNVGKANHAEFMAGVNGRTIIPADQFELASHCTAIIQSYPITAEIFAPENGQPEQSCFAIADFPPIPLKCRPDWLMPDMIVDLKTCKSIYEFERDCWRYRYDWQASFYLHVLNQIEHKRRSFVVVAIETKPPHEICIAQFDNNVLNDAQDKWSDLLADWLICHDNNRFPGINACPTTGEFQIKTLRKWRGYRDQDND